MNRLVLLGVGTCQLEPGCSTSAVLVELDDLRLVFDFGRGTADRLAGLGLRQDDVGHVVLSHFHPDHVSDLVPYLHAAAHSRIDPRQRDLTIHGPPGVEEQVERLLSLFEPESLVAREHFAVRAHTAPGPRLEIHGHLFDWLELPPAGNHGLRFSSGGRTVALTGDSDFHPAEVEFLRGADLAIFDAGHLGDDEIVELAVACQARRMICSHLYRELDAEALTAAAARRGFRGRLEVGRDLMQLPL